MTPALSYVRVSRSHIWHLVRHHFGAPAPRAVCGMVVTSADMWSTLDHYSGGQPLPICKRCQKASRS